MVPVSRMYVHVNVIDAEVRLLLLLVHLFRLVLQKHSAGLSHFTRRSLKMNYKSLL